MIGLPTAETSLEGRESIKAVKMAVDDINAKGGIKVGSGKKTFAGCGLGSERLFRRRACI